MRSVNTYTYRDTGWLKHTYVHVQVRQGFCYTGVLGLGGSPMGIELPFFFGAPIWTVISLNPAGFVGFLQIFLAPPPVGVILNFFSSLQKQ